MGRSLHDRNMQVDDRGSIPSMKMLVDFLRRGHDTQWHEHAKGLWEEFLVQRYGSAKAQRVGRREPLLKLDDAPYTALLHRDEPSSSAYGGMSLVLFPSAEHGSLLALGVGTRGISPDDAILARPGHARRSRALASWANSMAKPDLGDPPAWAKADPVRIDLDLPATQKNRLAPWEAAVGRYGPQIYLAIDPRGLDDTVLTRCFVALVDLFMRERGMPPLKASAADAQALEDVILGCVLASPARPEIEQELDRRRFVVLQGPPGVGKTRVAREILAQHYAGRGRTVQFHASTSYEQFVGGLAPVAKSGHFGFEPRPGVLMEAAQAAREVAPHPYLLHIDEINRADLARVLGEALYLLEPEREGDAVREVALPYDFGSPHGSTLTLPPNLHLLGTMNSADRSTAILDLAVRRRFSFLSLWPRANVLDGSAPLARQAFYRLWEVFVDQAPDAALELMPGHAYFIGATDTEVRQRLRHEVAPLLQSYLQHGLVAGFAEAIDDAVQWLLTR